MNAHSLKILEYPKIISLIKGNCLTPYGIKEADNIEPLFDKNVIEQKQNEISQMKDIINFGHPFPVYRMDNSLELLEKSKIPDNYLEPKEILSVRNLLNISGELNHYDQENRDKFPLINQYLDKIRSFPELKKEIEKAIDDEGEIKDNASSTLRKIRLNLNETKRKITLKLEQILSRQSKLPGWQDDIVTLRNDRYVIGIPTSQYHQNMGILHDRSQTGSTFFIEPNDTVELNNRINILYQEERQEIIRILKELSTEIGLRSETLIENCHFIGKLDLIHATAKFSNTIKGNQPIINDSPVFNLINVRHPLLIVQSEEIGKVVPNSINIDNVRQAILITGPNTGGKTVILKTIGLCILMAQSGLHIPVDEKSEVGIFRDIYADIGDEQSIELSLSTFSSHLKNIIQGLHNANENVLLLFDEIGVGTDPKEGSALAEAIILEALKKNTRLVVTTHYSQLKTLAMENPQLDNASLEFDRQTLTPTYRLHLGLPGASYAIEIAGRLGMPSSICQKALLLIGSEEKSLDNLIASLEEELKEIKKDKTELTEKLKKAIELEKFYHTQTEHLKKEINTEREKALSTTKDFLEQTRKEVEKLVSDIRKSQASQETVKAFHKKFRERKKTIEQQINKLSDTKSTNNTLFNKGDTVEILSFHQQGEIEQLIGNDKAKVKVGNVYTTVELRNLAKLNKNSEDKNITHSHFDLETNEAIPHEIHLRGMTVDEALEKLDKFLDRAIVNGLNQIYVIHGKGAGILRRTLTEYLKNHPDVASLRLGNWNEGGAGVTVVKLKE